MTNREEMLVSIAIDAAKNCIHVFEAEYPADDRSRKALEVQRNGSGNRPERIADPWKPSSFVFGDRGTGSPADQRARRRHVDAQREQRVTR
jgi:hypothetical protein